MVVKLQAVTFGITFKIVWGNLALLLHVLIRMYGVWIRLSKRTTGDEYYEYALLYVDDVLVISENAESVLRKEIGQHFVLRDESIGPPSQ